MCWRIIISVTPYLLSLSPLHQTLQCFAICSICTFIIYLPEYWSLILRVGVLLSEIIGWNSVKEASSVPYLLALSVIPVKSTRLSLKGSPQSADGVLPYDLVLFIHLFAYSIFAEARVKVTNRYYCDWQQARQKWLLRHPHEARWSMADVSIPSLPLR